MLSKHDLVVLEEKGWLYKSDVNLTDIVSMGRQLGKPIPSRYGRSLTDLLLSKTVLNAPKGSLSSIYGLEEFPFHTDGAYHLLPPKYIVLLSRKNSCSSAATRILDFHNINLLPSDLEALYQDVWLVKNGFKQFYTSILTKSHTQNHTILRYNKHCMNLCQNNYLTSAKIIEKVIAEANYISIDLEARSLLVLNNWRILHGRDKLVFNGSCHERVLERLFVAG